MSLDKINAVFEGGGSILVWLNVIQLIKDKQVKGVHWGPPIFFMLWGYWNMLYYPSLHQWFSTLGGAMLALGNTVWVSLMIKYLRKES